MKQLLQSLGNGATTLEDVPIPSASGPFLLVESRASVVSPGTERMLIEFGRSGMLAKVRSQPERVRQVWNKIKTDGVGPTVEAVLAKLDEPIPLGYCHVGIVREAGRATSRFAPGARVVTNGPHAEFVRVPWTLAARVPANVSDECAAFTPLAAIGLQGLRLATPTVGETVVVYGLGLIGLLTVQLVRAAGCRAIGIDPVVSRRQLAQEFGATVLDPANGSDLPLAVQELTSGIGADAVLLTLSTDADEPVHLAAEMTRKRGRLVLVGVAGLNLKRADFYKKELSLQVSCSYGPGRYDVQHEQGGADYPLPYVRWTEARNFEAVLQLMADGQIDPARLISHRFPFHEALKAYDVVTHGADSLGIVLSYPEHDPAAVAAGRLVSHKPAATSPGLAVIGCIGAGNFATRKLIPALADAGVRLRTIVSPGGTAASIAARQRGFEQSAADASVVFSDDGIDTVMVATRHDSHARYALEALRAGKHVFVEKPLALAEADVDELERAQAAAGRLLCVGFNRRFAPLTIDAKRALAGRAGPLAIVITVNAGALPADHWTKDRASGGGRIVGEACHFIDLARHFAGHAIVDVQATPATAAGGSSIEDICTLQLAFADGSIASIQYVSCGHPSYPKERVELFWDGKALQIDNFRKLRGWGVSSGDWWRGRQDKGHGALVAAFIDGVRTGRAPIPADEIFDVSRWAIRAAQLASRHVSR